MSPASLCIVVQVRQRAPQQLLFYDNKLQFSDLASNRIVPACSAILIAQRRSDWSGVRHKSSGQTIWTAQRPEQSEGEGQGRPESIRQDSRFGPRSDPKGEGQGGPESISPGAPFFNKLQDLECDSCPIADILSYRDIENLTNIYNILIYHAYRFVGKPQGSKGSFGAFALFG